jgi:hypothetical protein
MRYHLMPAFAMLLMSLSGIGMSIVQAKDVPQLEAQFSCNLVRQEDGDGERLNFADQAVIGLTGTQIKAFQWESSVFRSTHGHECSVDTSDEPQAELTGNGWRISLRDSAAARKRRGYDFDRGLNCSIRLERIGEELHLKPSCPALCGSRLNFSALTVNIKTGLCRYDE